MLTKLRCTGECRPATTDDGLKSKSGIVTADCTHRLPARAVRQPLGGPGARHTVVIGVRGSGVGCGGGLGVKGYTREREREPGRIVELLTVCVSFSCRFLAVFLPFSRQENGKKTVFSPFSWQENDKKTVFLPFSSQENGKKTARKR